MKQIRHNVFETNSSSVHSITMCLEDIYDKWVNDEVYFYDSTYKLPEGRDKFFTWEFYPKDGKTLTAAEALKTLPNNYSKVYINLGLNELGWDPYFDSFRNKLCEVIDAVRAWDSDIDIYLISVFPVSKSRGATVSWETLENVDIVNEKIMDAARQKQIYYVDVDTIFRDAEGYLPADYSNDGVHLNSPYVRQFRDYLLTHTVEVK